MNFYIVAAISGAFIAGGGFTALYFLAVESEQKIKRLQAANTELKDQLSKKEHTCSTSAGLIDAMAVLFDVEDNLDIAKKRAEKVRKILGITHDGPYAYPIDEPAGLRPAKKAK